MGTHYDCTRGRARPRPSPPMALARARPVARPCQKLPAGCAVRAAHWRGPGLRGIAHSPCAARSTRHGHGHRPGPLSRRGVSEGVAQAGAPGRAHGAAVAQGASAPCGPHSCKGDDSGRPVNFKQSSDTQRRSGCSELPSTLRCHSCARSKLQLTLAALRQLAAPWPSIAAVHRMGLAHAACSDVDGRSRQPKQVRRECWLGCRCGGAP